MPLFIKRFLVILAISIGFGGTPASAIDPEVGGGRGGRSLGDCSLRSYFSMRDSGNFPARIDAWLEINGEFVRPDGQYVSKESPTSPLVFESGFRTFASLTDADFADCGISDFNLIYEDGVTAPLAADSRYGVAFEATEDATGNRYYYETALVGATNTIWNSLKILRDDQVIPAPSLQGPNSVRRTAGETNTSLINGVEVALVELNPDYESIDPESDGPRFRVVDERYHDVENYFFYDQQGTVTFELEDETLLGATHHFPIGSTNVIVKGYTRHGELAGQMTTEFRVIDTRESTRPEIVLGPYYKLRELSDGSFELSMEVNFINPLRELELLPVNVTNAEYIRNGGYVDDDSQTNYSLFFKISNPGEVTISLPEGWAIDSTHNYTAASNVFKVQSPIAPDPAIEATQDAIIAFQAARANQVLTNQTDLTSFLTGGRANSARLSFAGGQGNVDIQTNGRVWTQITGSISDAGTSDQSFFLATVGSHKTVSENLLIGAMAQFDRFESSDTDSSVSGNGWLIGPYVVAKHATQPLYFEGRALFGATDNKVSPFNTYSDSFKTKRHLIKAKLSGELEMGTLTLIPNASVAYTKDRQQQYTDSLSNVIPNQSVSIMQGTAGLSFRKGLQAKRGDLTLKGGISAIFSETSTEGGTGNVIPEYGNERAKIDLGLSFVGDQGLTYELGGYVDGLGASGYQTMGLNAGLNFDF